MSFTFQHRGGQAFHATLVRALRRETVANCERERRTRRHAETSHHPASRPSGRPSSERRLEHRPTGVTLDCKKRGPLLNSARWRTIGISSGRTRRQSPNARQLSVNCNETGPCGRKDKSRCTWKVSRDKVAERDFSSEKRQAPCWHRWTPAGTAPPAAAPLQVQPTAWR